MTTNVGPIERADAQLAQRNAQRRAERQQDLRRRAQIDRGRVERADEGMARREAERRQRRGKNLKLDTREAILRARNQGLIDAKTASRKLGIIRGDEEAIREQVLIDRNQGKLTAAQAKQKLAEGRTREAVNKGAGQIEAAIQNQGVASKATLKALGVTVADVLVPGVWARNWNDMSNTDRAINIGLDALILVPLVGPVARTGARAAIRGGSAVIRQSSRGGRATANEFQQAAKNFQRGFTTGNEATIRQAGTTFQRIGARTRNVVLEDRGRQLARDARELAKLQTQLETRQVSSQFVKRALDAGKRAKDVERAVTKKLPPAPRGRAPTKVATKTKTARDKLLDFNLLMFALRKKPPTTSLAKVTKTETRIATKPPGKPRVRLTAEMQTRPKATARPKVVDKARASPSQRTAGSPRPRPKPKPKPQPAKAKARPPRPKRRGIAAPLPRPAPKPAEAAAGARAREREKPKAAPAEAPKPEPQPKPIPSPVATAAPAAKVAPPPSEVKDPLPPRVVRGARKPTPKATPKAKPRFKLPDGSELAPGVFPRQVKWEQGAVNITLDLISGEPKFSERRVPSTRTPRETLRVVTKSKRRPSIRKIRLGAVLVDVSEKSLRFTGRRGKRLPSNAKLRRVKVS